MNSSNHREQLSNEYRQLIVMAQADLLIFATLLRARNVTRAALNDVGDMLLMGAEINR